jgi:Ni/Co efflux regulator RcnB
MKKLLLVAIAALSFASVNVFAEEHSTEAATHEHKPQVEEAEGAKSAPMHSHDEKKKTKKRVKHKHHHPKKANEASENHEPDHAKNDQ